MWGLRTISSSSTNAVIASLKRNKLQSCSHDRVSWNKIPWLFALHGSNIVEIFIPIWLSEPGSANGASMKMERMEGRPQEAGKILALSSWMGRSESHWRLKFMNCTLDFQIVEITPSVSLHNIYLVSISRSSFNHDNENILWWFMMNIQHWGMEGIPMNSLHPNIGGDATRYNVGWNFTPTQSCVKICGKG